MHVKNANLIPEFANLIIDSQAVIWYKCFTDYNTKGRCKSMTIKELKSIIEDLSDDTVILVEDTEANNVEMVKIEIHMDGRSHLILSALE